MIRSSKAILGIPMRRLLFLTIVAVPAALIVLWAGTWLESRIPRRVYWQTGLVFLIALEVGYLLAVACAILGAPALAFRWVHGRRIGASRPAAARGLLACISLLFGLLMAEAATAVWRYHSQGADALPVWGLRRTENSGRGLPIPISSKEIPLPTRFPDPPGDGEIDVVVLGESSAEGVPYNRWVSIGKLVAWQLAEAIPGRAIRIQVVAMSGDTLEIQHQKLMDLTRRPDLLIVYCGHNEFGSRIFGSRDVAHYLDDQLPSAWKLLADQVESLSPFCGLIRQTAEKCRIAIPPPLNGDRALVDVPAYTPAEYSLVLTDFRRRLETIVSYGKQVGATTVLIPPPSNDAGFEPNRSFLPATTPRSEREAFRRDFLAARRLEAVDEAAGIAAYRALVARQPGFAEAHYRLALLLEHAGAWEEAYRQFVAARDHDGYPIRCLTAFQKVYHDVASRHDSILIDGQSYFHSIGRHGLLDDSLFHDGMHPSFQGQIALAQAVLNELRARRSFGWPEGSPAPVIDPESCAAHCGLGREGWRYICLWGIMFYQLVGPLRYDPGPRLERQRAFAVAAERIAAGEAPESLGLPNVGVRPGLTTSDSDGATPSR